MANESVQRATRSTDEPRVMVRGDGRTTQVHVQGPANLAIFDADQGRYSACTSIYIRRGQYMVINTLPLVDEEGNER